MNDDNKKVWIVVGTAFLIAVVGLAVMYTRGPESAEGPETVKVGAVLPMTGNLAFLGEPVKRGMDLAVERINAQGGVDGNKIELIYEDSQGQAKEGVSATRKLINQDGVDIVTTFLTGVSEAVKPVAEQEKVLLLAQTVSPTIAEKATYTIRMHYSFEEGARKIADYLVQSGEEPFGFVYSSDPSTSYQIEEVIIPELEANGNDEILTETFDVGDKEFRSQLLRMQSNDVNQLHLAGYGSDFPNLLQNASSIGVLNSASVTANLGFAELPDDTPTSFKKGVVFGVPPFLIASEKTERVKSFEKAYRKRHDVEEIGYAAHYAYDTIRLLERAIEASSSDSPKALVSTINSKTFDLMTGDYNFTNGDAHPPVVLGTFKDGEIVMYESQKMTALTR